MIDHPTYAARIRHAYAGTTISPIRFSAPDLRIDDAYRIQSHNTDYWLGSGRQAVGVKIGLTSKAVQAQLGVDHPDFGILFADMQVADAGPIAAARLLQPRIEAEIAFRLGKDLGEVGRDIAKVAAAIAYAVPALEIVDSRIADWDIAMVDTVADNASAGLFVLGRDAADIAKLDLLNCAMRLECSGRLVSSGTGAACMGNPLHAIAWLADAKARYGAPLRAGDIILSGALGPMIDAHPGDFFQAEIAGLGRVSVEFTR